jgi:hypothetical protein
MYDEMMFGLGAGMMVLYLAFIAFSIVVQWRVYEKLVNQAGVALFLFIMSF